MASLNKLAIRGIRSFDDKQISVIEFFSPVTVIVGHNGSGKTTIIECLKYATTGDQPPNTRGGAFIHDPKMANEKEVKAQVKLRFHAANGNRMLAVRNLSVTVKKTAGLTMKTLESILALADGNDKGGKRGVISTKCAEMDAEIPALLGVSKSVLENVIFCHQEDSYWPLAEPAALKKKFDDIFEATRYTKALDSIKALRKDRIAELKAEKERLGSLSLEKQHADKLQGRISDLSATIATKEIEYEETKKQYDELVLSNAQFYERSTKFREMYVKIENLQERKTRYEKELEEGKVNVPEAKGTDDELDEQMSNFDEHIRGQKRKRREEQSKREDLDDELARARKAHVDVIGQHGELQAEAKAQEERISDREKLIHEISSKNNIKGYDYTPLEREKVIEFISRLSDSQKKQRLEYEKIQKESRAKDEDYHKKSRRLLTELDSFKAEKNRTREQLSETQKKIDITEQQLDTTKTLGGELQTLGGDIQEKKARLDKVNSDIKALNYESKLAEKVAKSRTLEDRREELNTEIRTLSLQADSRARLELKRSDLKSNKAKVKNTLDSVNDKFRKLVGSDAQADTMTHELEHISVEKERHHQDLETEATSANKALQQAEITLTNLKTQLKSKREELKLCEKKLTGALEDADLVQSIKEATTEVNVRKELSGTKSGASEIYEKMLRMGQAAKKCTVCNRHLDAQEMLPFEKYLKEEMRKSSPESLAEVTEELKDWEEELDRLHKLTPIQLSRDRLKDSELPELEQQTKEQETAIPSLSEKAEEASDRLNESKRQLKDVSTLKQHAITVSDAHKLVQRLEEEVQNLVTELSATGSSKTADDVQLELDALTQNIRDNDREKQSLMTERERHNNAQRTFENDLNTMRLREINLTNQIRDKDTLETSISQMKQDIITFSARLKETETKITGAQGPIDRLEHEHEQVQRELNTRLSDAQRSSQELNMDVDRLESMNKGVERYVRNKSAKALKECAESVEQYQKQIQDLVSVIEGVREAIATIDKEINESGASVANLRENIRLRKLVRSIKSTQDEIDSYDMEEAAKAKRTFNDQYKIKKSQESGLQSKYAHTAGELSSNKSQLNTWAGDLAEFKDINKRYTDQLIKVKMSDMANNDLEKYGKALDNAIMKYHGLKMEEVNDTMRHLWNKTYQGTDIDGIKIRSDVEGGASKRSYNYRVVMTKDQVEMDMRGRCSAGQKMLASIIIRLALSDSFGQNCGILALDEPTNALDTENIDALAASLVDIINERKGHSNFQLIIITHDENFLRKLGQSDVMEYYWRVSRDSRQKSVIERQRFK